MRLSTIFTALVSGLGRVLIFLKKSYLLFAGNHPFYNRVILITVVLGLIFAIFAWVPYKTSERYLNLKEKQTAELSGQIQNLQYLLAAVKTKTIPDNSEAFIQRIQNQSSILNKMAEILTELKSAYWNSTRNQTETKRELSFYPSFSKKIRQELDVKPPFDEKSFNDFGAAISRERVLNNALLNLIVFEPASYFDKPLAGYETKELQQKLISLNEAIGQTELDLNKLSDDTRRSRAISEKIKSEHQRLQKIIDRVANNSMASAQLEVASWSKDSGQFQNSLVRQNNYLAQINLSQKDREFMNALLEWQKNLRIRIQHLKSKYF